MAEHRDVRVKEGWRGRFYEDFEVGDLYRHPLGRTVTEADNTWFTLLTMNTNQAHFNADVGGRPEAGIVTVRTRTLNQVGEEVLRFERTFYVHKRAAERAGSTFPRAKEPLQP